MSEDYSRYYGLKERNLKRYYELSVILRKHCLENGFYVESKKDAFVIFAQFIVFILLIGFCAAERNWLLLITVIPLLIAIIIAKLADGSDKNIFDDNFIKKRLMQGMLELTQSSIYMTSIGTMFGTEKRASTR